MPNVNKVNAECIYENRVSKLTGKVEQAYNYIPYCQNSYLSSLLNNQ